MFDDAMLKSIKIQVCDSLAVTQATSSHSMATLLHDDSAINARDEDILIHAQLCKVEFFTAPWLLWNLLPVISVGLPCLHCFEENAYDDPYLSHQNHFLILLLLRFLVVPNKFLSM